MDGLPEALRPSRGRVRNLLLVVVLVLLGVTCGDCVEEHLERTAMDLGSPGFDDRYGWGLVNAAAALR